MDDEDVAVAVGPEVEADVDVDVAPDLGLGFEGLEEEEESIPSCLSRAWSLALFAAS